MRKRGKTKLTLHKPAVSSMATSQSNMSIKYQRIEEDEMIKITMRTKHPPSMVAIVRTSSELV